MSPGKDQKASTPVSQSSQKKIMVGQSSEDGEEVLTCVKVQETRYKANLKKVLLRDQPTMTGCYTVLYTMPRVMMDRPPDGR